MPGTSYPPATTDADRRLDDLLEATVALLMRAVSSLGLPSDDDGDEFGAATPARSAGRIAADAARLTAAVAQLVRAHRLHTAPAPQASNTQAEAAAALVALLTELDAEAEQERTSQ